MVVREHHISGVPCKDYTTLTLNVTITPNTNWTTPSSENVAKFSAFCFQVARRFFACFFGGKLQNKVVDVSMLAYCFLLGFLYYVVLFKIFVDFAKLS